MPFNVTQWQERLERTFNEIVGPRMSEVIRQEELYGQYVANNLHGHIALVDSFQSFAYDSLAAGVSQYGEPDAIAGCPFHPVYLLAQLTTFRSIRAAENLLYSGYPLDGLSLLRDVKDRAVFFAAQISGLTTWQALNASSLMPRLDNSSREQIRIWKRACEREENRVLKRMLREDSDFEQHIKDDLRDWEMFFNLEVHSSRLTTASEFGPWLQGRGTFVIAPQPNNMTIGAYTTCAGEVFWMVHRTLPFLQLKQNAFGAEWAARWTILDESFREWLANLATTVPLARSIELFVTRQFSFTPSTIYVERNEEVAAHT